MSELTLEEDRPPRDAHPHPHRQSRRRTRAAGAEPAAGIAVREARYGSPSPDFGH